MTRRTKINISRLRLCKNEHFPSLKVMSVLDIFPYALLLSFLYTTINEVLRLVSYDKNISPNAVDIIVSGILLIVYVVMLSLLSKLIKRVKKRRKTEFNLTSEEISAVFLLALLLDSICLIFMSGVHKNERYIVMAIVSLTIYVGFTVSLDKLFDGDKEGTISYQLKKPFRDIELNFKEKRWTILLILFFVFLYTMFPYIVLILSVFVGLVFIIIIAVAKKRIRKFSEKIVKEFSEKRVLILQLGPSNAMTKTANQIFDEYCTENHNSITDLNGETYDAIVIFNTARKRGEHILKTDLNSMILNTEGKIIDPFRDKSKWVSFWTTWLSFPVFSNSWNTIEEYIDVL